MKLEKKRIEMFTWVGRH